MPKHNQTLTIEVSDQKTILFVQQVLLSKLCCQAIMSITKLLCFHSIWGTYWIFCIAICNMAIGRHYSTMRGGTASRNVGMEVEEKIASMQMSRRYKECRFHGIETLQRTFKNNTYFYHYVHENRHEYRTMRC